jgi:tetratricopeptide (TPR) repeat protein
MALMEAGCRRVWYIIVPDTQFLLMRTITSRLLFASFLLILSACEQSAQQTPETKPAAPVTTVAPADGFVDNRSCENCHQEEFDRWRNSHHDLAMQLAAVDTVLGDFNDSAFTHAGFTSRFFKKDKRFFVNTEGPDGEPRDFEIRYTFGVDPLQQYLVEFPDGRLQALTIAWDTRKEEQGGQRWFHLLPDEVAPPGDPLHWTGRMHNWNVRCAECHSTNLKKNFDPATDRYQTTWSEINVSCQACHGPGEAHVAWADTVEEGSEASAADMGLLVDYRDNDSRYQVETCARCHSRRHRVSPDDAHGRPLLDDFVPSTLREGLYHADGQILDEVYVYGSFLQSRMYHQGVRCSDCHDMHSTQVLMAGNALCVQCHNPSPPERFPTLQSKNYDSPGHHFHSPDSPDSKAVQCVDCHMPSQTYMVVDPRRDHSFRIPRPDLSVKLDVPNACTRCHSDKPAQWAADAITKWYGTDPRPPHYGEILARARQSDLAAYGALLALATDTTQPAIVTATALELLQHYGPREATARALRDSLQHADPLVRLTATDTLGEMPSVAGLNDLLIPLDDPVRAVRMEAAQALAPVPREHLDRQQQAALQRVLDEYREAQQAMADTPEAHLNLGVLHAALGDTATAEADYKKAVDMAPGFVPARVNLANLYNQMGRNRDAERQLRDAIGYAPDEGELYYSLGLLLAEDKRLTEAANLLATATRLLPDRARVQYNYALLLQNLERRDEAEVALQKAYSVYEQDPDIVYALVIFYSQDERWDEALVYARKLAALAPENPGTRQLVEQIEQQQGLNQ